MYRAVPVPVCLTLKTEQPEAEFLLTKCRTYVLLHEYFGTFTCLSEGYHCGIYCPNGKPPHVWCLAVVILAPVR